MVKTIGPIFFDEKEFAHLEKRRATMQNKFAASKLSWKEFILKCAERRG